VPTEGARVAQKRSSGNVDASVTDMRMVRWPIPPVLVLLVVPLAISGVLYWPVISVDAGWLFVRDSQLFLRHPTGSFHLGELVRFVGNHFVPVSHLTYTAMHALFGTWWAPWGVVAVVCHALLISSVAAVIYRFGGSLVAALAITLPLTTAWTLSSGVLTNFTHALIAVQMALIVMAPFLADRYLERSSGPRLAALFVASLLALFISIPGLLFYPAAVVSYVGLRAVGSEVASRRMVFGRPNRRDAAFAVALATSAVIYGALYWIALEANGWRTPVGNDLCVDTSGLSPFGRLQHILAYAYSGTFLTQVGSGRLGHPESPWPAVAGVTTLVLLTGSAFALLSSQSALVRRRRVAVIFATCVLMGVAGAAMLVAGRSCVALWHMRYNGYSVVFMAAAGGILLGVLLNRLHGRLRPFLSVALLVGAVWVMLLNAQAVKATTFLAERTHMAFASKTLERDLAEEP